MELSTFSIKFTMKLFCSDVRTQSACLRGQPCTADWLLIHIFMSKLIPAVRRRWKVSNPARVSRYQLTHQLLSGGDFNITMTSSLKKDNSSALSATQSYRARHRLRIGKLVVVIPEGCNNNQIKCVSRKKRRALIFCVRNVIRKLRQDD